MLHTVFQIIRAENAFNSFNFFFVDPGDSHPLRGADQAEHFLILFAGLYGQGPLQGGVNTAPEQFLALLTRKIMLVPAPVQGIIDGSPQVIYRVKDSSIHIKDHCFILFFQFRIPLSFSKIILQTAFPRGWAL